MILRNEQRIRSKSSSTFKTLQQLRGKMDEIGDVQKAPECGVR